MSGDQAAIASPWGADDDMSSQQIREREVAPNAAKFRELLPWFGGQTDQGSFTLPLWNLGSGFTLSMVVRRRSEYAGSHAKWDLRYLVINGIRAWQ
jgi:hypothetical protein